MPGKFKSSTGSPKSPGRKKKMTIKSIKARQIFDSRGNPTVEVDLETEHGKLIK